MTLIGVSALKNISYGSSSTTNRIGRMYQYAYDGITNSAYVDMTHIAKKGSNGNFINGADSTNDSKMNLSDTFFFSGTLSNVAIHNYSLTQADATALWDAKGVW